MEAKVSAIIKPTATTTTISTSKITHRYLNADGGSGSTEAPCGSGDIAPEGSARCPDEPTNEPTNEPADETVDEPNDEPYDEPADDPLSALGNGAITEDCTRTSPSSDSDRGAVGSVGTGEGPVALVTNAAICVAPERPDDDSGAIALGTDGVMVRGGTSGIDSGPDIIALGPERPAPSAGTAAREVGSCSGVGCPCGAGAPNSSAGERRAAADMEPLWGERTTASGTPDSGLEGPLCPRGGGVDGESGRRSMVCGRKGGGVVGPARRDAGSPDELEAAEVCDRDGGGVVGVWTRPPETEGAEDTEGVRVRTTA